MAEFIKLVAELARRTHDTDKDKSTDLDVAQASHVLKILREIAADNQELVLKALKIDTRTNKEEIQEAQPTYSMPDIPYGRRRSLIDGGDEMILSTAYSRHGFMPWKK